MPEELLLRGASLPFSTGKKPVDVLVRDGRIAQTVPDLGPTPETQVLNLAGYVLFPGFVEPHAHLDKAMLMPEDFTPGDLAAAIQTFKDGLYAQMSEAVVRNRVVTALRTAVRRGYTTVRTHVDCGSAAGLETVRMMLRLRAELADVVELQICALMLPPLTGIAGTKNRRAAELLLQEGVDVLGGTPIHDSDAAAAVREVLAIARGSGKGVDLHLDENTSNGPIGLRAVLDEIERRPLCEPVVASHCVALGQLGSRELVAWARRMREAGISVVTLPQSNLFLQGRSQFPMPRGTAPVGVLLENGVDVAGGGDNWRDPFNPLARIDPLETVSLLVNASHVHPERAVRMVTDDARRVIGAVPAGINVGQPADLVAIRGTDGLPALADASEERIVLRRGRVVARSVVVQSCAF